MSLSDDLISQFAKATTTKQTKDETTAYGTIVEYGGTLCVQLDGSDVLTPYASTAGVKAGDRVAVTLKNHNAIVTGNTTSPSAPISLIGSAQYIQDMYAGNLTVADTLTALNGSITNLEAENVTISNTLNANTANIVTLIAGNALILALVANSAEIEHLQAGDITVDELIAGKLDVDSLNATYANMDFANVKSLAVDNIIAETGMIRDLTLESGVVVKELVGVTIKGDLIEGNTIKADKLVVQGDDGLFYKLNVDSLGAATVEADTTGKYQNGLDGSVIVANSVTAEKISVSDLVAFDATIGGFNITNNSIYSGVKTSVNNTTRGIYLDCDGQICVGDSSNYIKFYNSFSNLLDGIVLATNSDFCTLTYNSVNGITTINYNTDIPYIITENNEIIVDEIDEPITQETYVEEYSCSTQLLDATYLHLSAGDQYTFSFNVLTNSNSSAFYGRFEFYTIDGTLISSDNTNGTNQSIGLRSVTGQVPANCKFIAISFICHAQASASTITIENINLRDSDNYKLSIVAENISFGISGKSIETAFQDVSDNLTESIINQSDNIVSNTNEAINAALDDYVKNDDYAEYKDSVSSQLNVLPETVNTQIDSVLDTIADTNEQLETLSTNIAKHFDFTENGLTITGGKSTIELVIDNDEGILFKQNGVKFGSWDGVDFHTSNIIIGVNERAQFGNFAFIPRSDGSLSFLKVGGQPYVPPTNPDEGEDTPLNSLIAMDEFFNDGTTAVYSYDSSGTETIHTIQIPIDDSGSSGLSWVYWSLSELTAGTTYSVTFNASHSGWFFVGTHDGSITIVDTAFSSGVNNLTFTMSAGSDINLYLGTWVYVTSILEIQNVQVLST